MREVFSQHRVCNRCNRLMAEQIVDEPSCNNCGCQEFRIVRTVDLDIGDAVNDAIDAKVFGEDEDQRQAP